MYTFCCDLIVMLGGEGVAALSTEDVGSSYCTVFEVAPVAE